MSGWCAGYSCTCPQGDGGRRTYSPDTCACAHCTNFRAMRNTCESCDVELSAVQLRSLQWLAGWEESTCRNIMDIVYLAFEAGREAGKP